MVLILFLCVCVFVLVCWLCIGKLWMCILFRWYWIFFKRLMFIVMKRLSLFLIWYFFIFLCNCVSFCLENLCKCLFFKLVVVMIVLVFVSSMSYTYVNVVSYFLLFGILILVMCVVCMYKLLCCCVMGCLLLKILCVFVSFCLYYVCLFVCFRFRAFGAMEILFILCVFVVICIMVIVCVGLMEVFENCVCCVMLKI